MKKLVFGLIATVTIALTGNAQTFEKPDAVLIHDAEVSRLISGKLSGLDGSLLEEVQKDLELPGIGVEDFNTEDVYADDLETYGKTVYTVNTKGDDKYKLGFCVLVDNKTKKVLSSSFVKSTADTFDHFFVEDASGFQLTKNEKGGVALTSTYGNKGKGLGQQYIDCINDAYANHGWLSVALFVGTLVEPWVGGGVAYHCYCQVFGM